MATAKLRAQLKAQSGETFANGQTSVEVSGRPAWAAIELHRLGTKGLRTIDCPATQLPFYIWKLRQLGVNIQTDMEEHGGPFSGRHACYTFANAVTVIRLGASQ